MSLCETTANDQIVKSRVMIPNKRSVTESLFQAYKIRKVEQALLDLFSRGKINGTVHTCVGQELTGVSLAPHLQAKDTIISNHRCHGHYLARYDDTVGLVAEIVGNSKGICKGYGGSQHLYRPGFFSSGVQGGMLPTAAGIALSYQLRGEQAIVIAMIGDGTLGQGIFYEISNLAVVQQLPLMIVVENNYISQSTMQTETLAGSIAGRASAFGMEYRHAHTDNVDLLLKQSEESINWVRSQRKPLLYEIETFRLNSHSKGDDLRPKDSIEAAKRRDALNQFLQQYQDDDETQKKLADIDAEIIDAVENALNAEFGIKLATPTDCLIKRQQQSSKTEFVKPTQTSPIKQRIAINQALQQLLGEIPELVLLGEDICDPYGGAFKVGEGLSSHYPERVCNMPISEAGIVGMGLGLATSQVPCIVEIMFGDFLCLAFDQLVNHAAKFGSMFGQSLKAPLIVRTPMGGGRGYGSTHSQSLEKFFLGIPGLDLYIVHARTDMTRFYVKLLKSIKAPSIVIENKLLYGASPSDKLPSGYHISESTHTFPLTRVRSDSPADITVLAFGRMSREVEVAAEALREEEIELDIFYPTYIDTLEIIETIHDSFEETRRLLIVEEGTVTLGLGSEIIARYCECHGKSHSYHMRHLAAAERPIPAARYLEEQTLPSQEDVYNAIVELFDA